MVIFFLPAVVYYFFQVFSKGLSIERKNSQIFLKGKLNTRKGKTEKQKNHEEQQLREKDKKHNCAREIQLKNRDIIRNCYKDGTSVQGL